MEKFWEGVKKYWQLILGFFVGILGFLALRKGYDMKDFLKQQKELEPIKENLKELEKEGAALEEKLKAIPPVEDLKPEEVKDFWKDKLK